MPLLERIRGAMQFAAVSVALALGACSDAQSGAGGGAGHDASSAGILDAAGNAGREPQGGAGGAGGDVGGGRAGSAAAGSGAAAGSSAGATAVAGKGLLGADCENDSQCVTGLTCLRASSTELDGAGPANGLCTLLCETNGDCTKLEAGAGCFSYGEHGYCLEACAQGAPADPDSKCRGRGDVACTSVETEAFCLPLCRADVECGGSRFCDRASGLCVDSKPVGDPVGAPCDPTAANPTCRDVCLRSSAEGVTPVTGICVEPCSGGLACMYDDAGTKPGGLCVGPLSEPFGLFDLGYCLPSCTCSKDCPTFAAKCRAWTSAEADYKDFIGKAGLCLDSNEGSSELTCP